MCANVSERNMLPDTAKIVEKNGKGGKRKDELRKPVAEGLAALGYETSFVRHNQAQGVIVIVISPNTEEKKVNQKDSARRKKVSTTTSILTVVSFFTHPIRLLVASAGTTAATAESVAHHNPPASSTPFLLRLRPLPLRLPTKRITSNYMRERGGGHGLGKATWSTIPMPFLFL